jgi:hypothetical protein
MPQQERAASWRGMRRPCACASGESLYLFHLFPSSWNTRGAREGGMCADASTLTTKQSASRGAVNSSDGVVGLQPHTNICLAPRIFVFTHRFKSGIFYYASRVLNAHGICTGG